MRVAPIRKFLALSVLAIVIKVAASEGDELQEFEDCLYQCTEITCNNNPYNVTQAESKDTQRLKAQFLPYNPAWRFKAPDSYLKALFWDCESNCDYQCQRIITNERKENGQEVLQFHGKWPFLRVFGIQEFASAVFSIANFFPHLMGFNQASEALRTAPKEKKQALSRIIKNVQFMALVTMCAWVFSTLYHIRDFLITEHLDYYFAGLAVLSGFYDIGYRYFRLYLLTRVIWLRIFACSCVLAYSCHVYRLVSDWLYTYNMRANIVVGFLQNLLWVLTCYSLYTTYYELDSQGVSYDTKKHLEYTKDSRLILGSFYRRSVKLYSLYPLAICTIIILGISLEVFDFPPIFFDLVDAHSLWHLVTAIPPYMGWYDWMIWDIDENVWRDLHPERKKKKTE